MNIYKLIFAKNEVISCELVVKKIDLAGDYTYEHDKGQLIYALIKAENETVAINKSLSIIQEVTEKTFGKDFVN